MLVVLNFGRERSPAQMIVDNVYPNLCKGVKKNFKYKN